MDQKMQVSSVQLSIVVHYVRALYISRVFKTVSVHADPSYARCPVSETSCWTSSQSGGTFFSDRQWASGEACILTVTAAHMDMHALMMKLLHQPISDSDHLPISNPYDKIPCPSRPPP